MRSELTLDIDFILEWIKSSDKAFRFRLVRADLRFLGVSDLYVKFGFPGVSIYPLPIDRIVRSDGLSLSKMNIGNMCGPSN